MAKFAFKSKLIDRISIPLVFALTIAIIHFAVWAVANRALPLMDAPPIVNGLPIAASSSTRVRWRKNSPAPSN